jgi:hypothetical protein
MEGCELTDQGKTVMLLAEYNIGVEVDVVNGVSVSMLKCVAAFHRTEIVEITICTPNKHSRIHM